MKQTPEEMYQRRIHGDTLAAIARDNGVTRQAVGNAIKVYELNTGMSKSGDIVRGRRHITAQVEEAKQMNLRQEGKHSSQYIGVTWHRQQKKWMAHILAYGRLKHLGYFDSEIEASKARQKALAEVKANENRSVRS